MLRSRLRDDDGFTLVELLVVVLIIAILAAIALAAYVNQRAKAQDTAAKTSATTAATAMMVFNSETGDFAGATREALIRIEPALAQARELEVLSDASTFTVTVESASADDARYSVRRTAGGELVRDCTLHGHGSCRAEADDAGNRW